MVLETLLGDKSGQPKEKIHAGEIFGLWQRLVQRYDIRELTDIFQNFANDFDFKALLTVGMNVLDNEITILETQMDKLGIPLPPRPPKSINATTNTEILRDELMFRVIYTGMKNFVSQQVQDSMQMQNKTLIDIFQRASKKELEIVEKLGSYGKLKGWISIPPEYKSH
ncbi:MAG: hypothetical protein APF76_16185 [Desulfitibacter sp. BRH_c19]|nr:MAG: hypothetical protein APF76_16185 [Desulfitibacter sp. BRH_c19]